MSGLWMRITVRHGFIARDGDEGRGRTVAHTLMWMDGWTDVLCCDAKDAYEDTHVAYSICRSCKFAALTTKGAESQSTVLTQ